MSRYALIQDLDRCIGCRACEVHCKTEHDVPVGPKLGEIVEVGPVMIDGIPRIDFVFMACYHCSKPLCAAACPTGAMYRDPERGLVRLDRDTCIGCGSCIQACPWGVPQRVEVENKVMKCDFCADRLAIGEDPACVQGCTTSALQFVDQHEVPVRKREQYVASICRVFDAR